MYLLKYVGMGQNSDTEAVCKATSLEMVLLKPMCCVLVTYSTTILEPHRRQSLKVINSEDQERSKHCRP